MKNTRGFTLIELMITIAILAIIVGIAVPAYQNQVEKTRRADAISGLMQTAQQMERCFTRDNTYDGCAGATLASPATLDSPDRFYDVKVTIIDSGSGYSLEATGRNAQSDDDCSPFTLNHLGAKDAKSTTDRCWGQN